MNKIEEEIEELSENDTSMYKTDYVPFELYLIAIQRGRRIAPQIGGHVQFAVAREASRMTAYVFLEEIKKLMPQYYEHFREIAANVSPD